MLKDAFLDELDAVLDGLCCDEMAEVLEEESASEQRGPIHEPDEILNRIGAGGIGLRNFHVN